MMSAVLSALPASIPSPPVSFFMIGPITVRFYALCIILGIIVATFMANHHLTRRGAERWVIIDILLITVPISIVCARIYHVLTHPGFYFGPGTQFWHVFAIWEGGIAIYGALIGGAIGALLGCRWTGVRFWSFADAIAPGLILAQAMGRFGNYFNHELFGLPTDWPWGLQIESTNAAFPPGLAPGTLFQPTFLYEVIWNTLGCLVLLWAGRGVRLQWGRLFGLYLVWYSSGRIVWESIRIDPSEIYFGLRSNVWAAILGVVVGIVILVVQRRRHPGLEPSVYVSGRGPEAKQSVQSQNTPDYVDISEPDDRAVVAAAATSATGSAEPLR